MSLPALHTSADTRSITERVNVLIRDYNNPPAAIAAQRYVPAGVVFSFAGAVAPDGFLLCHGQAVSRAIYADLFAAIGTVHGAGDGSSTFNLPDLRGRVVAGKDDMGGSSAGRLTTVGGGVAGALLGAAGGAESHTLTVAQMPSHDHALNFATGPIGTTHGFVQGTSYVGTIGSFFEQHTGGDGPHSSTQPTIVLNHVIAT